MPAMPDWLHIPLIGGGSHEEKKVSTTPPPDGWTRLQKGVGMAGLAVVGILGGLGKLSQFVGDRLFPAATVAPELFQPKGGIESVLIKAGPQGPMQSILPRLMGGPYCIFHYLQDYSGLDSQGMAYQESRVYGAIRQAGELLALPTGLAGDVIQGKLLCWPVAEFAEGLVRAQQMYGYEGNALQRLLTRGKARRGIVNAVREDGSNAKAFWFFQLSSLERVSNVTVSEIDSRADYPDANNVPAGPAVQLKSISSAPPTLSGPVFSLATVNKDGSTNMNILTYAVTVGRNPSPVWVISLYQGTLSHENFFNQGFGVLQLLKRRHAPLVDMSLI
eukprot:g9527.t1